MYILYNTYMFIKHICGIQSIAEEALGAALGDPEVPEEKPFQSDNCFKQTVQGDSVAI